MASPSPYKGSPSESGEATIGELIRSLREKVGLTQTELARGICARAYISQIERGSRFPGPLMLVQVAKKLEAPLPLFTRAYASSPMVSVDQCLGLAKELAKQGALTEAHEIFEHARGFSRKLGKPAGEGVGFKVALASILLHGGEYEQGEKLLEEVLARGLSPGGSAIRLAEVYTIKGQCAAKRRDFHPATEMLHKAFNIAFAIRTGPPSGFSPRVVALQYEIVEWLIRMFLLQRQFHTAKVIFQWALSAWEGTDIEEKMPYHLIVLGALSNLGLGNPDATIKTLEDHLSTGIPDGDSRHLAAVHNNLAVAYRLKKNWNKVRYHASIALDLWRHLSPGDMGSHGSANELAYAALAQSDYEGARRALDFTIIPPGVGYKVPDIGLPAESLLLEARLALAQNDAESALNFLDRSEEAGGGIRWVETMAHIERVHAALIAGEPIDKVKKVLDALRSSVANWAV